MLDSLTRWSNNLLSRAFEWVKPYLIRRPDPAPPGSEAAQTPEPSPFESTGPLPSNEPPRPPELRVFDAKAERAAMVEDYGALGVLLDEFQDIIDGQRFSVENLAPSAAALLSAAKPELACSEKEIAQWMNFLPLAPPAAQVAQLERLSKAMKHKKQADGGRGLPARLLPVIKRLAPAAQALALSIYDGKLDGHGIDFCGAHFPNVNLEGRVSHQAKFDRAVLTGANFRNAQLHYVSFESADLSGADFRGALLNGTVFRSANLSDADFTELQFFDDALRVDLSDAKLTGANLRGARLRANLTKAKLTRANLRGADFSRFDLLDADFTEADLRDTVPPVFFLFDRPVLTDARLDPRFVKKLDSQLETRLLQSSWSSDTPGVRERLFNHLANEGRSILMSIESIPAAHDKLKLRMVERLLRALDDSVHRGHDISDVFPSVFDVLAHNPLYRQSSATGRSRALTWRAAGKPGNRPAR